jgi:hypothetical protein
LQPIAKLVFSYLYVVVYYIKIAQRCFVTWYKVHLPARSCLFLKSQRSLRARHMHAHAQVMIQQLQANENTVSSNRQN